MGNENNQGAAENTAADSQPVPAGAKLSVLGEALGFGKTAFEQPSVKPKTNETDSNGSNPSSEQPLTDSDTGEELDNNTDNIENELDSDEDGDHEDDDPDSKLPVENDPLALLFDSETLYDIGDDEPVTGAELQNRLMRQSDYTQKTQAIAAERTELETERQGYADNLTFFDYANQNALSEFERVDWRALSMQNPAQYQELLGNYQQLQARQSQIDNAKEQFLNDFKARNSAAIDQKRAEAIDSVRGSIPDIETLLPDLESLAKETGFSDDELPQLLADPRALKLLVNSHRVNTASKKAKDATKPKSTPQPRPRAKASQEAREQTEKARLTKAANNGDQKAARALLASKLSNKMFDRFNGRKD
ncbi:hypothetical protein HOP38_02665 [Vibrio mediterranei]|uniref:hypothetical protein n=1 Tax=Vibrio mediterranei TaxID=689 RepID=UPI00179CF5D3|nr:hypothetical protein [Vibrio mediterranei]NUW71413.1 hypothetical protein [Vibrio mediterranei]